MTDETVTIPISSLKTLSSMLLESMIRTQALLSDIRVKRDDYINFQVVNGRDYFELEKKAIAANNLALSALLELTVLLSTD